MSFGEPSPDPVETADGFMVGGPSGKIGLNFIVLQIKFNRFLHSNPISKIIF